MKKGIFWIIIYAAVLAAQLTAQSPAFLIETGSRLETELETLILRSGMVSWYQVKPWSLGDALQILALIDDEKLSETDKELKNKLRSHISAQDGILYSEDDFVLGLEGYAAVEGYIGEKDPLLLRFDQTKSLTELNLYMSLNQYIAAEGRLELSLEPFAVLGDAYTNTLFFEGGFSNMLAEFPYYAYTSIGDIHSRISMGRYKRNLGPGHFSNLVLSSAPWFTDGIDFRTNWKNFAYSFSFIYLEPWLTSSELSAGYGDYQSKGIVSGNSIEDRAKSFVFHRVDMRLFDRLGIALSEGIMFGRKYPDLRLLNPFLIYHNLYEWYYWASLFSAEARLSLLPGLEFYGEFAFNQIQTPYEVETYSADSQPKAAAYMAGLRYSLNTSIGLVQVGTELYHTDPFYMIREHPYTSYHWRHRLLSNYLGARPIVTEPLGFFLGPDSQALGFWASLNSYGDWDVDFEGFLFRRGVNRVDSPWSNTEEAVKAATPWTPGSASVEYGQRYSLTGSYQWGSLQIQMSPGLLIVTNKENVAGENEVKFLFTTGVVWEF
jgi:hypothetical protein